MTEKIKVTFLGTGSAIPTARRSHPAILLQYKAENILFECGEGTQRRFRKARLNPCKISKIFISHWHGDHTFGLPGLLNTLRLNGYNRKLEIYGPLGSKKWIRKYLDLVGNRGMDLDIVVKETEGGVIFDCEDFKIEAGKADHDCPAVAYSFIVKEKNRLDKDKLKDLEIPNSPLVAELVKGQTVKIDGKRIDGSKLLYEEPSRKISIIMDTRYSEGLVELVNGSDLLICESTYSVQEKKEVVGERAHLTSVEAAKIAKKAKVSKLALVHLSQRYDVIPKAISTEAKEVFENVFVPEDLDKVEV